MLRIQWKDNSIFACRPRDIHNYKYAPSSMEFTIDIGRLVLFKNIGYGEVKRFELALQRGLEQKESETEVLAMGYESLKTS